MSEPPIECEFEKWALANGYIPSQLQESPEGEYMDSHAECAYQAWEAAYAQGCAETGGACLKASMEWKIPEKSAPLGHVGQWKEVESSEISLLPCPFCGITPKDVNVSCGKSWVHCENNECPGMPQTKYMGLDDAICA